MATYTMYAGGRKIAPPDNIKEIYQGEHLIWKRASGLALRITKVFESALLKDCYFTKIGDIIPGNVIRGQQTTFFDITGKQDTFTIPDFSAVSSGVYIWSDEIAYRDEDNLRLAVAYRLGVVPRPGDWLPMLISPGLTDTEEQWSTREDTAADAVSIAYYLKNHPTSYGYAAGGGKYPFSRPLGGFQGESGVTVLSHMTTAGVHTGGSDALLWVCGDRYLYGENLAYKDGYIYGRVTERGADGTIIRTLQESWPICPIHGNPKLQTGGIGPINRIGELMVYQNYRSKNSYTVDITNVQTGATRPGIGIPLWTLDYMSNCYLGVSSSDPGQIRFSEGVIVWMSQALTDTDGVSYRAIHSGAPGDHYCSGSAYYVIGKTAANAYALLKIEREA